MRKLKHRHVYQDLRDKILEGSYAQGQQLPSQRELMSDYEVSFATITSALNALTQDNLIRREHGKGTFVQDDYHASLATHTITFGYFMSGQLNNPTGVLKGVFDVMQSSGYRLEFILFKGETERRQKCQSVLAGEIKVDGVLIPQLPGYNDVVAMCQEANFPYVVLDVPFEAATLNHVLCDHRHGAKEGVEHLVLHGHRDIGFLGLPLGLVEEGETWQHAKWEGYNDCLVEHNIEVSKAFTAFVELNDVDGIDRAIDKIVVDAKVTALFVGHIRLAKLVMDKLIERKIRVPLDVALASFNVDEVEYAELAPYRISGVSAPRVEVGVEGVKLLTKLVENTACAPLSTLVPTQFIRRRSCGCV